MSYETLGSDSQEESVPINRLPGVKDALHRFCIHPDGSIAVLFNNAQMSFVCLNLTNGQHAVIKTELVEGIESAKIIDLVIVNRLPKFFILSLAYERMSRKMHFIAFYLNSQTEIINVVDINTIYNYESYSYPYFIKDDFGKLYFLSSDTNISSTNFRASQIEVDSNGKLLVTTLTSLQSFIGDWCTPFIYSGYAYFVPADRVEKIKLLKKSYCLNKETMEEIDIKNDIENWQMNRVYWSKPQVVHENIFYYVYEFGKYVGFLIKFDLKAVSWQKIPIEMGDHIIDNYRFKPGLQYHNGFLYLHCHCRLESCSENVHMFIIKSKESQAGSQPLMPIFQRSTLDWEQTVKENIELYQTMECTTEESSASGTASTSSSEAYISALFNRMRIHPPSDQSQHLLRDPSLPNELPPEMHEGGEVLGKGNFGIVYKCWDAERRRYYVAKKTTLQRESLTSALNEVKRLKDLRHPRIIEYYGCNFNDDGGVIIFMEYMPLGSIGDLIRKHGAVAEKTTIIYITQVLDGLVYVHNRGIVHNDLKCDNLLSDHKGDIKIGDFGLAVQKQLNDENISYINTKSDVLGGGTAFWTAPEFFDSELISRKSDIWSLGCTIVEMLTTKPPYWELKKRIRLIIARARNEITYNPKELVPAATEPMHTFIGALLQINPANRLADATEATEKFHICCS